MNIADQYFNNCREISVRDPQLMSTRVRYSFFARKNGVAIGCNKAVNFIKDQTYGCVVVRAKEDGEIFLTGEPVLVYDAPYYEAVTLETTILGFLSFSGAATNMRKIVEAADGVPVIDMSARHYPWQIIEETALAAYLGGAAGTSTQAGYDYVQKWYEPGDDFRLYASLPHAQAAVSAQFVSEQKKQLFPSVIAAKMFHETFPDRPITVLVDYEGKELEVTEQAFKVFGDKLFAVRLDTHGSRFMQSVPDDANEQWNLLSSFFSSKVKKYIKCLSIVDDDVCKYFFGKGVTIAATYIMRKFLDEIGAKNVKIVVSSGFNENKTKMFRKTEAPMDFIGTGSWVDFMMFTADITHVQENGIWVKRLKVGREHGSSSNLLITYERF
ncbi:hypothetical protein K8R32_04935 [bacterium]|nr:hypothetical protein [bacterium]